jgi:hypothetical protein
VHSQKKWRDVAPFGYDSQMSRRRDIPHGAEKTADRQEFFPAEN